MQTELEKVIAEWNTVADSEWYMGYRRDDVITKIITNPSTAFHKSTWEVINKAFSSLKDKKICVPSSGDNRAVFAFAALGAEVISCDICDRQLEHASRIAEKYNLKIDFLVQDTMKLPNVKNSEYDLVYTSEGVHVWINDLNSMYKNIFRVLRPGGTYINYEIHPFSRPFAYDDGRPSEKSVIIRKLYESVGPFDDGTTYHWRMQDIINAVVSSGLTLKKLEEMHDERDKGHFWFYEDKRKVMSQKEIEDYYNWETNPLAALPQWFTIYATK